MDYVISTLHAEPQSIVSIRERHARPELPTFIQSAFPALFDRLRLLGVDPAGPPLVIYHDFGADGIDAEVCVPVDRAVSATGRVQGRVLPAMTVARTLHVGRYEELETAYAALTDWITRNGFEFAGPIQERYLNGPGEGVGPSEYRTEIEVPVVPLAVAAAV